MIYEVSTKTDLITTLKNAVGGDVIRLLSGNYGEVSIDKINPKLVVTIVSASSKNKAIFKKLYVSNSSNLTFRKIVINPEEIPSVHWEVYGLVGASTNIKFIDSEFNAGKDEVNYQKGYCCRVTDSVFVVFRRNVFKNAIRGLIIGDSKKVLVDSNNFYKLRSDGIDLAGVNGVKIVKNWFHDFYSKPGSGDHLDMIQMWSTGVPDIISSDIEVDSNVLDMGNGSWTQSIFMRNEIVDTGVKPYNLYKNIKVTNNWIRNGHLHGITIGATDGLTIANNILIATHFSEWNTNMLDLKERIDKGNGDDSVHRPRIYSNEGSKNVKIVNNDVFYPYPSTYSPFNYTPKSNTDNNIVHDNATATSIPPRPQVLAVMINENYGPQPTVVTTPPVTSNSNVIIRNTL